MYTKKENLNLILLNAAKKVHHADWNWKGVNSPFTRLYMVETGSAKIHLRGEIHTIEPGFIYMIPSFITHSYENDNTFTLYYIHIYEEQNIFDRLSFPFRVNADDLDLLLIKRLLLVNPGRELKRSDPNTYDNLPTLVKNIEQNELFPLNSVVETKGILMQLFSRFLGKASFKQEITDHRILKVVRYIRENINKNISIENMSTMSHLTNDHFIRLFKKEMNCTPVQYINLKKIEKAQLMIIVGDKSIKDISFELSFDNLSYFYRLFKKTVGMAPNKYKERTMIEKM